MLWTERLFQLIPIGKESGSFASFLKVRLIRSLCVTFILGLISALGYIISGVTTPGANGLLGLLLLFIAGGYGFSLVFLTFVVSGWFQNKWDWFFGWSSHILKLSETEFGKFRDRIEKLVNSFFACLIIAVIFFILGAIPSFAIILKMIGPVLRPTVLVVWLGATNFFLILLMATLLWIILSMWITFYVTLRQPLSLKLSHRADEEFRPLAIWSLKVLLVSFALVAIIVVFKGLGILVVPGGSASFLGLLIFLMMMGVFAFILPFYHVHRVLMKLKERELREIEGESNKLMQDLAQTASKNHPLHSEERTIQIIDSLVSLQVLQIRERRAKEADAWPIDTTILSILAGIALLPILSQLIINLLSTFFAS